MSSFELRAARVAFPESYLSAGSFGIALGLGLGRVEFASELPAGLAVASEVAIVLSLLASGVFLAVGFLRRVRSVDLEMDPREIRGPSRPGSRRRAHLPLEEICTAQLAGWGPFRRVVVAPRQGRALTIPTPLFVAEGGPEAFLAELRGRLQARPDSAGQIRGWERAADWGIASRGRTPWVTLALSGVALLGFGTQLAVGALGDPEKMIALGGNFSLRVFEGEVYRLVTANFLHAGWLHLTVNLVLLLLVGSILERLLGAPRFLLIAGLSALGGAFSSALNVRFAYSVGISTVCLGLVGCGAALNARFRDALPPTARGSRGLALLAVAQWALYELASARSDFSAHLGGLLTGMLVTFLATCGIPPQRLPVETPPWVRAGALVVLAVLLMGLARGIQQAVSQLGAA